MRKNTFARRVCVLLALVAALGAADYAGPVAALRIEAAEVGKDWVAGKGLVVDDFAAPPEDQEVVKMVRVLGTLGVNRMGVFDFRRAADTSTITLRTFAFATSAQCRTWIGLRTDLTAWPRSEADGWTLYAKEGELMCLTVRDNVAIIGSLVAPQAAATHRQELMTAMGALRKRVDAATAAAAPAAPAATGP